MPALQGGEGGHDVLPMLPGNLGALGRGLGCPCLGHTWGGKSGSQNEPSLGVSLVVILYRTLGLHPLMTRSWRW